MKIILFTAAAALSLSAASAIAGEGNGDPFPFRTPGVMTITTGRAILPGATDDPYPFKADGILITPAMANQVLPTNGSEGAVQSVNSMPLGAEVGTPSYAYNWSVQTYFAARDARAATRLAKRQSAATPPNG